MTETFNLAQRVSQSHSTLRSEARPPITSSGFTQMRLSSSRSCTHPRLSPKTPPFLCSWEFHACGLHHSDILRKDAHAGPLPGSLGPVAASYGFAFAHSRVAKAFCCFTAHFVSLKNNVSSENSKHLFSLASLWFMTLRKPASHKR